MSKNGSNPLLVKDGDYVTFDRLLKKAEAEGRIDGPCKCLTCGMRYTSAVEAQGCCDLAEKPGNVPAPGLIMGSRSGKNAARKVGIRPKTNPFIVSLEALDIEFTLDKSMIAVLDSIDLSELLPGETIQRSSDTDRELFITLLAVLFDKANGFAPAAFKIARTAGMELHQLAWAGMVMRLKKLGLLVSMTTNCDEEEESRSFKDNEGLVDEIVPNKTEDEEDFEE